MWFAKGTLDFADGIRSISASSGSNVIERHVNTISWVFFLAAAAHSLAWIPGTVLLSDLSFHQDGMIVLFEISQTQHSS